MTADLGLFFAWLNAHETGKLNREKFVRNRFQKDFKPAFDAWLASGGDEDIDGNSIPFTLPEYKVPSIEKAKALEKEAGNKFETGQKANETSDGYVLTSVILSSVLFFAGIALQFDRLKMRMIMLAMAAVMCAVGLYRLAIAPTL